ncbi:methyltransferase domain-containing protein [Palleronia sp. LCG004]|uniref:methyltransferase domain-containing protein n=1 Tax=Palleronia sp. LCG004 TaxID=3079304 RepID=UPI002941DD66|nr:methyltransferase domain-containing protein [Palleronia sp. LCG004]WOI55972.1 methyltransferase domain-containing protein [Palleronia sp. LCG004]
MTQPPRLTDRAQLARNRSRFRPGAAFLHEIAADELKERLEEVNRQFTEIAVVTGQPEFWAAQFPGARIVPDEDRIDLEPESYDLVIHAMSLHWADDPVGQIVQSRRALRPDGLFLCVTLGGQTLSELRIALAEAETALRGGISPRVAPMGEIRDLGGLIQRGGLAQPVADTDTYVVSYRDARHLMRELREMGEGNALAARDRRTLGRGILERAGAIYADRFAATDAPDRIRATFELIFLSGWAPHESQQKPLRPGSAQARLADILETARTGPDGTSRDGGD